MANYNLVVNSTFQPFSFERYIQPYQMYGEAYKEVENTLADLNTKASVWEGMANEQTDPQTYAMYKKYADDLKNQANLLASKGLTPGSRKTLLDMKSRYSKEITPIEEAYTKRQKLIDEQREALLRDNTLIFDKDYRTASLDDIIKNPNASYTPLSGKDIATRTAAMAKEAGAAILSDPEYSSVFNSQYVQQKIMQGYDMSQILAAAQRDPNAPKALLGIVDAIKGEVGYENWSDDNKKKIDSYINEGLRAAVGTPKIDVMANRNFISEIDRERLDLDREQFEWQKEQALGIKQPDGSYVKPIGGGRVIVTKPNGDVTVEGGTDDSTDKDLKKLQESLHKATDSSHMRNLGYTPSIAVIRGNDGWSYGREKQDIAGYGLWPNTNLRTGWWGNISYSPDDSNAEFAVVNDNNDIPGYKAYESGEDYKNTAFGKILEAAELSGLIVYKTNKDGNKELDEKKRPKIDKSKSKFFSSNVQVVKVKSPRPKGRFAGEEYDYLIYTR